MNLRTLRVLSQITLVALAITGCSDTPNPAADADVDGCSSENCASDADSENDSETDSEPSTVFSPIPIFGDRANYEELTPERWQIVEDNGDIRYHLADTEYTGTDGLLGEFSLASNSTFTDVAVSTVARTAEDLDENGSADICLILGFIDENNYYYAMFNSATGESALYRVEGGLRAELENAEQQAFSDNEYHTFTFERVGTSLTMTIDGVVLATATDGTFGEGRVGIGGYNDSVFFDDINFLPISSECDHEGNCSVESGSDRTIEPNQSFLTSEATTAHCNFWQWTTSGTGTFNDSSSLEALYTPSQEDVSAGQVTLTLTACNNSLYSDSLVLTIREPGPPRIFPGAVGFGTESRGAYEGSDEPTILIVDTLDGGVFSTSETSGTLRWCLLQDYPRIILFSVAGLIDWSGVDNEFRRVEITSPYLNVYGQSAPEPGITITGGYPMIYGAHDILIQHLKIRPGDAERDPRRDLSCFGVQPHWSGTSNHHVVVDHCSFSWSTDQLFGTFRAEDVTISNSLLAEALEYGAHPDPSESRHAMMLTTMYPTRMSVIGNLFAHGWRRTPLMNTGVQDAYVANNLIYNITDGKIILRDEHGLGLLARLSVIGNEVISSTEEVDLLGRPHLLYIRDRITANVYMSDNASVFADDYLDMVSIQYADDVVIQTETPEVDAMGHRPVGVTLLQDHLFERVGAFYWNRDQTDLRILDDVEHRTGITIDSLDDLDDTFLDIEQTDHKLSLPADPHHDDNDNGYTNLEEWVNTLH